MLRLPRMKCAGASTWVPVFSPMVNLCSRYHRYRRVTTHRLHYKVQNGERRTGSRGSLVEGGAKGGFAGSDVLVLEESNRFADVSGIADHTVENIPICTVAGKIFTTRGPAIGIFHQYAYFGEGSTIHSPHQLAHFGLEVDDKSIKVGGQQRIVTPDGVVIPLNIADGLPTCP